MSDVLARNTLCLDIGNTSLFAGIFDESGEILLRFRKSSIQAHSADEYGIFLRAVLRENGFNPDSIDRIAICSVVPDTVYSIRRACHKYFGIEPFVLKAGIKTGLQIAYRNPVEVGADRIANAVAAYKRYPERDCIIVDFGTATTFDALNSSKVYLGGAIVPGLRISMESLEQKTARLPSVEIVRPNATCGRSTVESIQSGLFFGHVGIVREMVQRMSAECFQDRSPIVIATGGFSSLFEGEGLFSAILPDLVLEGTYWAMLLNGDAGRNRVDPAGGIIEKSEKE